MTSGERAALTVLATIVLLGGAVRLWSAARAPSGANAVPSAAGSAPPRAQIARIDSARASRGRGTPTGRKSAKAAGGAVDTGSASYRARVDVDRATLQMLDALPGMKPAVAKNIVRDREVRGTFGCLGALKFVAGVTPALVKKIGPIVRFSGPARHPGECG